MGKKVKEMLSCFLDLFEPDLVVYFLQSDNTA